MNERTISVEDAKKKLQEKFPVHGYMDRALKTTINIANTIKKYIALGSKILDFGSGPCDKTVFLFKCML